MSDAAKHDLIGRLLDMGARVEAPGEVKTIDQVPKKNIELRGVAFNPRRDREWTEEDFAIMPELADVPNFGIEVPVADAAMEHLRKFRTKDIRLSNLQGITLKGFEAVGSMPELERMNLGPMPIDDAGFRAVVQGPKLKSLAMTSFETLTDAGWAGLATTNLDSLQSYVSPNVTAEGWAQLAGAKKLREIQLNGKPPEGILAGVSKIGSLEVVNIGFNASSPLAEEEFAPLGALPKVHSLRISNSPITGAMFTGWPERPQLRVLWLPMESSPDDAGLTALLKALPKLEEFVVYFETVTDAQVESFKKHKLPWLRLHKNTSDEVWNKLKKGLPKKRVERLQ